MELWFVVLGIVIAVVLLLMVLLMILKRRFRRNKAFVSVARLTASIFVQFLALLVLILITNDPGPDALTEDVDELLGHDARDALYIFIIVLMDIATLAVISFFKSSWVEPILR